MKFIAILLVLAGFGSLSGCAVEDQRLVSADQQTGGLWSIHLTSPAFEYGEALPIKYTEDGQNMSPPLAWVGVPPETRDLVLILQDPNGHGDLPFVHWIAWHLPVDSTGIVANASRSAKFVEGTNGFGQQGYDGPEPPPGEVHHFYFQLYALDKPINLPRGASLDQVVAAMHGHVLAKGQLLCTYMHPKKG